MALHSISQKQIDHIAQETLSPIDQFNLPFQILRAAHFFKTAVEQAGLYSEDDQQSLTHSEKYRLDSQEFTRIKEMLALSADLFDTAFCCVTNKNTGDGVIFIGNANHVYASRCLFACLSRIVLAVRDNYLPKVAHYKKESTREDKVNEYMDAWLDQTFGEDRYCRRRGDYDAEQVADYIREHFSTTEEQQGWLKLMSDVLEPLNCPTRKEKGLSVSEIRDVIQNKFPNQTIEQTVQDLNNFRNNDMVVLFMCDDAIQNCFESETADEY